jgi:GNAT superfamily N-acetyltransferase
MTVVRRVAEVDLEAALARQLAELLRECFPGYPDRAYFKLPPHLRLLAHADDELVGQLAVELRMIRVADQVFRTLGVVDLCVRPDVRSQGVASLLLDEVLTLARHSDFVILFADDDRLYGRNGWVRVDNPVTWLKVHEHTTLGLAEKVVPGVMMVRPTGTVPWPPGDVDLLGHLF